ncbi:MAG: rhamnogalacturonan acetylesterase [Bacteroidales bacterium]|nr:rhamnogalacturonan acetylesterase [Bacteroidales bacterium]
MRFKILFLTFLLFACSSKDLEQKKITIYLIGDSTMANKENPDKNPEFGWGQVLQQFFKENATVENHAVNGRSSRSFISEGRWDSVLNKLQPGDYVFIQFGHNDQKFMSPDRYTNPWSSYRDNLEKYVDETRQKGANPILLSSIIRRHYNEWHTLIDTHGPYPYVAREVAKEKNVPFIDMQLMTERLVDSLGEEPSRELFMFLKPGEYEMYPEGRADSTHLTLKGATIVAGLAIKGLKETDNPLVEYLKQ